MVGLRRVPRNRAPRFSPAELGSLLSGAIQHLSAPKHFRHREYAPANQRAPNLSCKSPVTNHSLPVCWSPPSSELAQIHKKTKSYYHMPRGAIITGLLNHFPEELPPLCRLFYGNK
ncbi:hypothetical protein XENTR_v10009189 [Xenopus tropicalis]|nr:hypothetical protein XENTR_v10009189 [Xenopus tropicalis]